MEAISHFKDEATGEPKLSYYKYLPDVHRFYQYHWQK